MKSICGIHVEENGSHRGDPEVCALLPAAFTAALPGFTRTSTACGRSVEVLLR